MRETGQATQPPPLWRAALPPGRVTLAGAGPGDPELLTLKAHAAIRAARLVLYDHLVSDGVLALLPIAAERIYVGKKNRDHSMAQQDIIQLLVAKARSGQPVLRLKGGDPFIFGRGGEETQALAAAGIPFEVIPGISAAQAMSAYAGIPLTHRDHAAAVVLATGHCKDGTDDLDWPALARPRQTVVIYMGVGALGRICEQLVVHGLPASTPAAVVENASCPNQRVLRATLSALPALAQANSVRAPALIVVGHVVDLARQLAPPGRLRPNMEVLSTAE